MKITITEAPQKTIFEVGKLYKSKNSGLIVRCTLPQEMNDTFAGYDVHTTDKSNSWLKENFILLPPGEQVVLENPPEPERKSDYLSPGYYKDANGKIIQYVAIRQDEGAAAGFIDLKGKDIAPLYPVTRFHGQLTLDTEGDGNA